jgi:hypothetical protein
MTRVCLGLDLGQVADYTALCTAVERPQTPAERAAQLTEAVASGAKSKPPPEQHHDVPRLVRWPLGTSYPAIVEEVVRFAAGTRQRLPGAAIALAIDATGVGRPVVDLFALDQRLRRLRVVLIAITITGGTATTFGVRDDGAHDWHVPKRELIGASQMLLQTRRLHVAAGLGEAENLTRELRNFKMKITVSANMQMEAWREGQHDDLVLAGALASWVLLRGPLGDGGGAAAGGKRETVELRQGDEQ